MKKSGVDWGKVKNFEKKEWINNPALVEPELVYLVDELVTFVKSDYGSAVCIIRVAYDTSGHSIGSQHYVTQDAPLARAVDLYFKGVPLLYQFLAAERLPFTGIGCYPFWKIKVPMKNSTKKILIPGLHLDIRVLKGNVGARWWRDEGGEYHSLNENFFASSKMIWLESLKNTMTP